jgi:hypothetical protein
MTPRFAIGISPLSVAMKLRMDPDRWKHPSDLDHGRQKLECGLGNDVDARLSKSSVISEMIASSIFAGVKVREFRSRGSD